ncbi:MAG TPA: geranylgeranyl reductase family protein [Gemmatimonadaceae bacterium]
MTAVGVRRQGGIHPDVVIVGGGPAGSSLAVSLARRGAHVLILDRARFPRPKPCAEYLSPQASRVLHSMSVLEDVEQSGAAQLAGMVVRAPNGTRVVGEFAGCTVKGFRDRGLSVRREVLDAILLRAAQRAGAEIRESTHVVDVIRGADARVRGVRTADGTDVVADVVVGADGLRSVVARRLGLARSARWPRRYALVTHYSGVGEIGECGEMHVEPGGFVGIADVGGGLTTVALVVPSRRAKEFAGGREAFLERWLAERPQLSARFSGATRVSPVVATGPFASRARRAWSPGVALVGDAADFFDPFTGEGIYAALRGGEMLAPFVVDALGVSSARHADAQLAAYDRLRRREFGGKWIVEWIIGAVVASPRLMNRAARVLAARKDMADLLVGVTGDFVPASAVLNLRYILSLFVLPLSRSARNAPRSTR